MAWCLVRHQARSSFYLTLRRRAAQNFGNESAPFDLNCLAAFFDLNRSLARSHDGSGWQCHLQDESNEWPVECWRDDKWNMEPYG
jgi:hypothetical protein